MGLFKPKKITSATLDLEAKIAPTIFIYELIKIIFCYLLLLKIIIINEYIYYV